MEKKLALLLGVLLLLFVAQFFGADLQVKANETTNSELGSGENSKGKGDGSKTLNSVVNHSDGRADGDGVEVPEKKVFHDKTKPKKHQNEQKIKKGSTDEKKNKKTVGLEQGDEKAETGVRVDGSEKGLKNNAGNDGSGSDKNKKPDDIVGQKEAGNERNKNQGGGLEGDAENNDNSNGQTQTDSNEDDNMPKEGSSDGTSEKQAAGKVPVDDEAGNKGDDVKENGSSGNECYLSIKCTDQENELIGCLRVPGNESPHLSLLIQNKSNDTLSIGISAPNFVQLETTKVQLQQKEKRKVEVSIGNGGTGSLISLTSGDRVCELDFKDLMSSFPNHNHQNLAAQRPNLAFLSFSALLILVLAWMFLSYWRRKLPGRGGFPYQKVDMALPITSIGKQRSNDNDRWDENWGDGWNDEEAPRTPSKPSQSVSSKRSASRRLSKETWKG